MSRYIDVSMMLLAVAFFFALTAWQDKRDRSGGPQREGKRVLSLESEPDQPKGTA